jgi:hypothetical protein
MAVGFSHDTHLSTDNIQCDGWYDSALGDVRAFCRRFQQFFSKCVIAIVAVRYIRYRTAFLKTWAARSGRAGIFSDALRLILRASSVHEDTKSGRNYKPVIPICNGSARKIRPALGAENPTHPWRTT